MTLGYTKRSPKSQKKEKINWTSLKLKALGLQKTPLRK